MSPRERTEPEIWVLRCGEEAAPPPRSLQIPSPSSRSSPALTSRSAGWGAAAGLGSGSAGGSGAAGAEAEAPDAAREADAGGSARAPRPARSAPGGERLRGGWREGPGGGLGWEGRGSEARPAGAGARVRGSGPPAPSRRGAASMCPRRRLRPVPRPAAGSATGLLPAPRRGVPSLLGCRLAPGAATPGPAGPARPGPLPPGGAVRPSRAPHRPLHLGRRWGRRQLGRREGRIGGCGGVK